MDKCQIQTKTTQFEIVWNGKCKVTVYKMY